MTIISSPQQQQPQQYTPYQDLTASSRDNSNSVSQYSDCQLDAKNIQSNRYTTHEKNSYQQQKGYEKGKKGRRTNHDKPEEIFSNEDSHLFGGNNRCSAFDGRLQGSSMSAVTIADDWLTSIENSFVKLMLRPNEFLVSQFQSMDGINSPLPESIQQCNRSSGDVNKYKVNSKSNRYNT